MTYNVETILTILSIGGVLFGFLGTLWKIAKGVSLSQQCLLNVEKDIAKIYTMLNKNDDRLDNFNNRLIVVEQSVKACHRRLDELKDK